MNGDWRMIINNNVPGFQLNALSFQSHELLNLACTYIHLFSFMKWRSLLICWIGPSNIQNWIFNHFISNGNSNVDAYLVRRLSHRASIWHIKTFMKGLISHKAQSISTVKRILHSIDTTQMRFLLSCYWPGTRRCPPSLARLTSRPSPLTSDTGTGDSQQQSEMLLARSVGLHLK